MQKLQLDDYTSVAGLDRKQAYCRDCEGDTFLKVTSFEDRENYPVVDDGIDSNINRDPMERRLPS